MIVTTWGTRGSLPVCSPDKIRHGGNTTCIQVESECLAPGLTLCVDAGTGFLPLCWNALKHGFKQLVLLQTHYHHDHTQGFLIAPPIYMGNIPIQIFGPIDQGVGPKEAYARIMEHPWHPVSLAAVSGHVTFHGWDKPDKEAIVFHPAGGVLRTTLRRLDAAKRKKGVLDFGESKHRLKECLMVTMHHTDHPQRAVCFRFEEGPSGRVFIFLTDEEARSKVPESLVAFLREADLLIQDSQYSEEIHRTRTAGFGHGTPPYAVKLAKAADVRRMGLTHHDPSSTDNDIDKLVRDAKKAAGKKKIQIFSCKDFQRIDV